MNRIQFVFKKSLIFMMLGVLALTTGMNTALASPTVKTEWSFPVQIGYEEVAKVAKLPLSPDTMLIDSRPYEGRYVHGYIPTAVSLPDSAFEKKAKDILPENKQAKLIFYCQGPDCVLSHTSAYRAQKMGYQNVAVYTGGLPDWEAKGGIPGLGVEGLKVILEKNDQYMLVDSRPANKFAEGSIPTAISIPDSKFNERKGMLPADKGVRLIFFCGGYDCMLSHLSADKARALGYTNIAIAEAGYPGWTKSYGSGAAVGQAKPADTSGVYPVIEFEKALTTGQPSIMVIDVRNPAEFAAGSMPGAVNITVEELEKKLPNLPLDKPVVFVCTTGSRSGEAYYMAMDVLPASKNFFYLEASIKFLEKGKYQISPNSK
jgi:Rhodanese-related sulfurtransferase